MTEKEFTAAAEQHLDMVYRIALNCLRNPADAEDAAQTAMLRLWRSGQAFPDDNQLRHWLVRVTVNACKMPAVALGRMVPLDDCREPVFVAGAPDLQRS
ncbi:MAG: RNA polymerase sigma factor [Dysosmobacter welbionis]